jgi:hypothetical protein
MVNLFDKDQWDFGLKIVGMIVLALVIVFLLIWSGLVQCKSIPYGCDAYDLVMGGPRILIVSGESGLGTPEKLKTYLQDPRFVGAMAVDLQDVERISLGNLKKYKLVVVEHAKLLSADQLQMFKDYVDKYGGRLVWVGDAGTQRPADELAGLKDQNTGKVVYSNAWARVKEDPNNPEQYLVTSFDEFLGLRYIDNYCNQKDCSDKPFIVGRIESEPTGNHPLIFGTSPALDLRIKKDRDFSLVRQIANSPNSNMVLTMNFGGMIYIKDGNLPRTVPLITTSNVGAPGAERVAYYAYPPEWFLEDNNYIMYIKNMYLGMLGR